MALQTIASPYKALRNRTVESSSWSLARISGIEASKLIEEQAYGEFCPGSSSDGEPFCDNFDDFKKAALPVR